MGLGEVVFAVAFAWLLVDQPLRPVQLVGGGLVVGGIALVRIESLRAARLPDEVAPVPSEAVAAGQLEGGDTDPDAPR